MRLLYVGQTKDAKRRLRDLPIGESHHLATTVPPEIWERVIVIQWPNLLLRISAQEAQAAERLGLFTCGLAVEYLLQVAFRPVLNSRRRSTNAGWITRNIESSRSRGAVASLQLPELSARCVRSGTYWRTPSRREMAIRWSTQTVDGWCSPAFSEESALDQLNAGFGRQLAAQIRTARQAACPAQTARPMRRPV